MKKVYYYGVSKIKSCLWWGVQETIELAWKYFLRDAAMLSEKGDFIIFGAVEIPDHITQFDVVYFVEEKFSKYTFPDYPLINKICYYFGDPIPELKLNNKFILVHHPRNSVQRIFTIESNASSIDELESYSSDVFQKLGLTVSPGDRYEFHDLLTPISIPLHLAKLLT